MTTRRLIFAAVLVFLAGWGALTMFALQESRERVPAAEAHQAHPRDTEQVRPRDAEAFSPTRFSLAEIARHDQPDDCWLLIRGRVYDVTSYIASHPAPRRTITDYCGGESTEAFDTKERERPHTPRANQLLETYFVGEATE